MRRAKSWYLLPGLSLSLTRTAIRYPSPSRQFWAQIFPFVLVILNVLFVEMLGRRRGLSNTVKNEPQQRPGVRFERSRCVIVMVLKTYRKRQPTVMPYYIVVVRNHG